MVSLLVSLTCSYELIASQLSSLQAVQLSSLTASQPSSISLGHQCQVPHRHEYGQGKKADHRGQADG